MIWNHRVGRDGASLPPRRWAVAAAVAALAHASMLWIALHTQQEAPASESAPAVLIELSPVSIAADAPQQDVAPGPTMTETPPEAATAKPAEKKEESRPPDPLVEEPEPDPAPEVRMPTPHVENSEVVLPPPKPPAVGPRPQPTLEAPRIQEKPVEHPSPAAPQTTAPPPSTAQKAVQTAAPSPGIAIAPSRAVASWRNSLLAHLNSRKRFPPGGSKGVASIRFTIDRGGRVMSASLTQSSGDQLLDHEAVALAMRASPVPMPPVGLGGSTISIVVPIRFDRH